MLLARKGYRVLLADKASFPSNVVNGYYVQQTGGACLKRWGLLDRLRASNCPPLFTLTFDFGDFSLSGSPPAADGVAEGYAPRRLVLDKMLADAAVEAVAELRESFAVEELLWDGDHVTGVRSRTKAAAMVAEHGSDRDWRGRHKLDRRLLGQGAHLQCQASAHLLVLYPLERRPG
jgi:flavin-dependent dehydrogenase